MAVTINSDNVQEALAEAKQGDFSKIVERIRFSERGNNDAQAQQLRSDIVTYLLASENNVDVQELLTHSNARFVRRVASHGDHENTAKLLEAANTAGATKEILSAENGKLLRDALESGNAELADTLLRSVESLTPADIKGILEGNNFGVLKDAVETGNEESVNRVLQLAEKAGVTAEMLGERGEEASQLAEEYGLSESVQRQLSGADPVTETRDDSPSQDDDSEETRPETPDEDAESADNNILSATALKAVLQDFVDNDGQGYNAEARQQLKDSAEFWADTEFTPSVFDADFSDDDKDQIMDIVLHLAVTNPEMDKAMLLTKLKDFKENASSYTPAESDQLYRSAEALYPGQYQNSLFDNTLDQLSETAEIDRLIRKLEASLRPAETRENPHERNGEPSETPRPEGEDGAAERPEGESPEGGETQPEPARPTLTYDPNVAKLQGLLALVDPQYKEFMTYTNRAGEEVFQDGMRGGKTDQVMRSFAIAEGLNPAASVQDHIKKAEDILKQRKLEADAKEKAEVERQREQEALIKQAKEDALAEAAKEKADVEVAKNRFGEKIDFTKTDPDLAGEIQEKAVEALKRAQAQGYDVSNGVLIFHDHSMWDSKDGQAIVVTMNGSDINYFSVSDKSNLHGVNVDESFRDEVQSEFDNLYRHDYIDENTPVQITAQGVKVIVSTTDGDDLTIHKVNGTALAKEHETVRPSEHFKDAATEHNERQEPLIDRAP